MILNHHDSGYNTELKHGIKPLCAFCDREIDPDYMDATWYWIVHDHKVYYAHAECGQDNVKEDEAERLALWLSEVEREEDEG